MCLIIFNCQLLGKDNFLKDKKEKVAKVFFHWTLLHGNEFSQNVYAIVIKFFVWIFLQYLV